MKINQSIFYKKIGNESFNLVFIDSTNFSKSNYKGFRIHIKIKNLNNEKKDDINQLNCCKYNSIERPLKSLKIHFNNNLEKPFYFLIQENYLGHEVEIILMKGLQSIDKLYYTLTRQKKWKIFLLHYSHTDIGYTDYKDRIENNYYHYYRDILKYCRESCSAPEKYRFKWNCENLWQVENFFKKSNEEELKEFIYFVKQGQIEICANYFNFTELLSKVELMKSLNLLNTIKKKYNILLETSMITDEPACSYLYPKYLPVYGIKFLNVSPHCYCARPVKISTPFYWRYKDNRKILVWKSDDIYTLWEGVRLGFSDDYKKSLKNLPEYLKYREKYGYKNDYLALRLLGTHEENGPGNFKIVNVAERWNDEWEYPKVEIALNKDFYHYILGNEKSIIELSGIWPDWWSIGSASMPKEVSITKDVKRKIFNLEKSLPFLVVEKKLPYTKIKNDIYDIYNNLMFSDEHTYGSLESTTEPESINSKFQYLSKSLFAYNAAVKLTSLIDETVGKVLVFNEGETKKDFYIYNINNSAYEDIIEIDIKILGSIDEKEDIEFEVFDCVKSVYTKTEKEEIKKEYINRIMPKESLYKLFFKLDLESFSFKKINITYKKIKFIAGKNNKIIKNIKSINGFKSSLLENGIENNFYRIRFNEAGQIIEIFDKEIDKNIFDNNSKYKFNSYIYDEIKSRNQFIRCRHENADNFDPEKIEINIENYIDYWDLIPERIRSFGKKDKYKPLRQFSSLSKVWKLENKHFFTEVEIHYNHKIVKNLRSIIKLYNNEKKIEFINSFFKIGYYHPHAIFYSFPFKIENFKVIMTNSDTVINPKEEQLEGSSTDWYSTSGFICLYNEEYKILFYQKDSFIVFFNDINLGKWTHEQKFERPHIFSNVYNNYWDTNFYPSSHGELIFRYIIKSEILDKDERRDENFIKYGVSNINEQITGVQPIFNIKNTINKYHLSKLINISRNNVKIDFICANSSNNISIIFEECAGIDCEFEFSLCTKIKFIEFVDFLNKVKNVSPVNSNSVNINITKFELLKVNLLV